TDNSARPLAIASSCLASSHMRAPQDCHAQVGECHPGFLRRHRHQRMPGHPGRRVHFEKLERAVRLQHEIEAAPSAAAEDLERSERGGADLELLRLGKAAWTEVF